MAIYSCERMTIERFLSMHWRAAFLIAARIAIKGPHVDDFVAARNSWFNKGKI